MSREFFNARAAIWDDEITEQNASRLAAMASRLDIAPGAAVLDVGTGTGIFIPFVLEKIGEGGRLVCLDYAEAMLQQARAKGFGGNIEYRCVAVEDSGLPDDSFDAVVAYSVFPHFDDKPQALREMYRVLRDGGHLFICHTSSRRAINEIHLSLPEVCDHLLPEPEEMRRLLAEAGFAGISVEEGEEDYFATAVKGA